MAGHVSKANMPLKPDDLSLFSGTQIIGARCGGIILYKPFTERGSIEELRIWWHCDSHSEFQVNLPTK